MSDNLSVSGVTYEKAGHDYVEKGSLKRHAGVWSLWALGVAAVIIFGRPYWAAIIGG